MQKRHLSLFLFSFLMVAWISLDAQTFTMGKSCRLSYERATTALQNQHYDSAMTVFETMKSSCKTKDAKIAIAAGEAEAYNGLGKYTEAIAASNEALRVSKNKSLNGWFQRSVAESKSGQAEASKSSLQKVMQLTQKNINKKDRAANYALMAALYDRQLDQTDSAHMYIDKAIEFDNTNSRYYVEKGDMYARKKQYDKAFEQYEICERMGGGDLALYESVFDTRLRMMQEKYGTTNTQELRGKLDNGEKETLCAALKKAQDKGLRDMSKDMLGALICK